MPAAKRWIGLHVSGFGEQGNWIRSEIDQLGVLLSKARMAHIGYIFRTTLELEIDFHSAPFDVGVVPS